MFLIIEDSVIDLLSKCYITNQTFTNNTDEIKLNSLNKYLLSAYYVLEIVLGIGYTRVNKTVSALKELKEYVYWRGLL